MALFHSPQIVTNGLVLCLDAANTKSYPGTGTTWTDLSGNGNNGTLTNGPTFSSANGGSIVFDGVDDYINITGSTAADFGPTTDAFTIDITYKSFVSSTRTIPSSLYDRYRYYFYHNYTDNSSFFTYVKKEYETSGGFPTHTLKVTGLNPKGSWNNVVFTYVKTAEDGTLTGYRNGVLSGSSTSSRISNYNLSTHFIGNSNHSGFGYYSNDGTISIVKVYNRALIAQEIQQNFNATRSRFGI